MSNEIYNVNTTADRTLPTERGVTMATLGAHGGFENTAWVPPGANVNADPLKNGFGDLVIVHTPHAVKSEQEGDAYARKGFNPDLADYKDAPVRHPHGHRRGGHHLTNRKNSEKEDDVSQYPNENNESMAGDGGGLSGAFDQGYYGYPYSDSASLIPSAGSLLGRDSSGSVYDPSVAIADHESDPEGRYSVLSGRDNYDQKHGHYMAGIGPEMPADSIASEENGLKQASIQTPTKPGDFNEKPDDAVGVGSKEGTKTPKEEQHYLLHKILHMDFSKMAWDDWNPFD